MPKSNHSKTFPIVPATTAFVLPLGLTTWLSATPPDSICTSDMDRLLHSSLASRGAYKLGDRSLYSKTEGFQIIVGTGHLEAEGPLMKPRALSYRSPIYRAHEMPRRKTFPIGEHGRW